MPSYLSFPIWGLALLFLVSLLVACEFGHRLRRRYPDRFPKDEETFAMTSVLGLLALLIGFTFSLALQRHETRRELVVHEANAIGTTWLRMDLLDAPQRDELRALLRRYVDSRIAFGNAATIEAEEETYRTTATLQDQLWAGVVAATQPFRDTPRAASIISTTNESIDLAGERLANRESHVPPRILRMLWFFAIVAAGMVGFEKGSQRLATTLLFLLLTLAVALVLDLDRPASGMTRVSQQPMIDLRESMRQPAFMSP